LLFKKFLVENLDVLRLDAGQLCELELANFLEKAGKHVMDSLVLLSAQIAVALKEEYRGNFLLNELFAAFADILQLGKVIDVDKLLAPSISLGKGTQLGCKNGHDLQNYLAHILQDLHKLLDCHMRLREIARLRPQLLQQVLKDSSIKKHLLSYHIFHAIRKKVDNLNQAFEVYFAKDGLKHGAQAVLISSLPKLGLVYLSHS